MLSTNSYIKLHTEIGETIHSMQLNSLSVSGCLANLVISIFSLHQISSQNNWSLVTIYGNIQHRVLNYKTTCSIIQLNQ